MSEVAADPASLVGQCLAGRYDLEQCIGRGPTGATYRAKHVEQQRTVVVKVFGGDVREDMLRQRRFELDTSKLAALAHPSTPAILGFGVHHGLRFVVREWLEGESLAKRLEAGPLPLESAMTIARQLLAALASGHAAKVLHRNLHPNNVFIEARKHGGERVKLLDFARAPREPNKSPTAFTPPERTAGERLDARSDVFAIGALVAAMLRPANLPPLRPAQPATNPASDTYAAQGALASAAVVAVLSTAAPGNAAAPQPVVVTTVASAAARDSTVDAEPAADEELPASSPQSDSDLVSAFDDAFTAPVVGAEPAAAAAAAVETPLERWIRRAMAPARQDRFDDAADMLRELVDRLPRDLRVTTGASKAQRPPASPPLLPSFEALPAPAQEPAVVAGPAARTAPLPVVMTLLPPPAPPSSSATPLPETSPIALHSTVEPGTTQLTAATAIGAFTLAALVILVMPGELGRASRAGRETRARETAPAPVASQAPVEPAKPPASLTPIPLSAIALTTAATQHAAPPPAAKVSAVVSKPKLGKGAPPRDPWRDPVPKELQRLRARAVAGAKGDKADIEALRIYNGENAGDPRGYLVTARFYLNRLWRTDSVGQYAAALERDPTVRGAPEILPALLDCVTEGKASGAAGALIEKTYGNGAVPAIDQALERVKTQSAAVRLSSLSEKLLARAP